MIETALYMLCAAFGRNNNNNNNNNITRPARSTKCYDVRPSVCPTFQCTSAAAQHAGDIDTQQQLQAVSCYQLACEAGHRLVCSVAWHSQAFFSSSAHWHAAWPQRRWSYDLMVLCKSVLLLLLFLAHQHKACRQLKIKQEMTAVGD